MERTKSFTIGWFSISLSIVKLLLQLDNETLILIINMYDSIVSTSIARLLAARLQSVYISTRLLIPRVYAEQSVHVLVQTQLIQVSDGFIQ